MGENPDAFLIVYVKPFQIIIAHINLVGEPTAGLIMPEKSSKFQTVCMKSLLFS